MVIVRCFASGGFYLERVVFPFEILNFQAPGEAEVEVWSHGLGSPELVSTLTIEELICSESVMTPPLELINR